MVIIGLSPHLDSYIVAALDEIGTTLATRVFDSLE